MNTRPLSATDLRLRAEAIAEEGSTAELPPAEAQKLLHELRVHQIELEMQNEELRRAQKELEASQARYFELSDLAPVGYCTLSEHGLLQQGNLTAARLLGLARKELLQLPFSNFILNNDVDRFYLYVKQLLKTGEAPPCELQLLRSDGVAFWAQLSCTTAQDEKGALVFLLVFSDSSAAKAVELALAQSHALLTNLAALVPGVVYQYRLYPDGRSAFPYASPGMNDIYEVTPEQVREDATPVFRRLHPEDYDRVAEAIQASAQTLQEFFCEFRVLLPRQGLRWRWSQAHPERLEDGSTLWHGIIIDLTERKLAQEANVSLQNQLLQSQKMESLGTLAGGVAHDMNNVLGAILGLSSAHLLLQPAGSPAHQAFATITTAATRGGKLVKSLLAFARDSPAENLVLNVNDLVREEIRLLEHTTLAKVRLAVDLDPELHPIRGDGAALTHAFMNLCVNAIQAMGGHGTLALSTRNLDADTIEVVVADTGSGMTKEVLDRALEPFFTTKGVGKGTGLGLSMVYSTVKAHHGTLEIASEPGQGTRVRLLFPACAPELPAPEVVADAGESAPSRSLAVLLVDDDELVQGSIEAMLEILDHTTTAVFSGEAALAKLETGYEPDVVILDMNMPGLSGAETLPLLRLLRPTLPVLLATGRADQAALDLVATDPHLTLLPKPFPLLELKQCLDKLGRG